MSFFLHNIFAFSQRQLHDIVICQLRTINYYFRLVLHRFEILSIIFFRISYRFFFLKRFVVFSLIYSTILLLSTYVNFLIYVDTLILEILTNLKLLAILILNCFVLLLLATIFPLDRIFISFLQVTSLKLLAILEDVMLECKCFNVEPYNFNYFNLLAVLYGCYLEYGLSETSSFSANSATSVFLLLLVSFYVLYQFLWQFNLSIITLWVHVKSLLQILISSSILDILDYVCYIWKDIKYLHVKSKI